MEKWISPSFALAILLFASTAGADVPNEPCAGAAEGDACTTGINEPGTCVEDGSTLVCRPESEDGCAVAAPGGVGSPWSGGALALVALGAGLSLRRYRRS